jgi:hypothetical protein
MHDPPLWKIRFDGRWKNADRGRAADSGGLLPVFRYPYLLPASRLPSPGFRFLFPVSCFAFPGSLRLFECFQQAVQHLSSIDYAGEEDGEIMLGHDIDIARQLNVTFQLRY